MSERFPKMAVRVLIVGGVAALALVTAARRCDKSKPVESEQENASESSAPAPARTAAAPARPHWCLLPHAAPAGPLSETQLMARLRSIKESNPAAAIELAAMATSASPKPPMPRNGLPS